MKGFGILFAMALIAMTVSAPAAVVLQLNFDSAAVVNDATYDFGVGDIPASGTVSIHFNKPYVGSERDYGLMPNPPSQIDPGVDTGKRPSIVTPAVPGFQGGNALFTCDGSASDPQSHIGWYINSDNGLSVNGDFTGEAIFMLAKIGTTSDPVVDSEYSLHNVFGTEMIAGPAGAVWKFRVWPNGPIGGVGQIQLNCGGNSGGETNVTGPSATINTWYHAACVYTAATNTAEFFLNGVSQGTTNPNWGGGIAQNDWWVGAWPSNGANRGLAGWIDAVALSDTALVPANFVLPTAPTSVNDWTEY
jgi:hypothetical protein